jgi:hypothetical protein
MSMVAPGIPTYFTPAARALRVAFVCVIDVEVTPITVFTARMAAAAASPGSLPSTGRALITITVGSASSSKAAAARAS